MYYVSGLLNHLKVMQHCMAEMGGEALMNVSDLSLDVRIGTERRRFWPQFVVYRDGRRVYSADFTPDTRAFVGWRPYEARRWPTTADKLLFKEFARTVGVRIPETWTETGSVVQRVIIKQRRSSFGVGIRGPFETVGETNPDRQLGSGEYYERFIPGRIAKAWYLDGAILCLEVRPPPFVTGDGRSTVLELARERSTQPVDEKALAWLVAAQGRRTGDVLESGRRLVVDYRYGSPLDPGSFENENLLETLRPTAVGRQFEQAGPLLLPAIPEEMRHDTLITLDAVVDAEDQVWFLEINSNPAVHPDAYPVVLKRMFGATTGLSKAS